MPFGLLWYAEPTAASNAIGYAEHRSRSHDAVIRVYDAARAIMAFWNLSVTIGNLWVLVANAGVQNSAVTKFIASTGFGVTAFQMFFFAAFAFAAALAFGLVARTCPLVDHYRQHDE